jgi:indolepyruvate ferredoxin oxidoreductase
VTGHLVKREFGPWVGHAFGVLARLKGLRGTPFDIFGYTAERRMERRLAAEYAERMLALCEQLTPANHAIALQLASLPETMRGFGHVKEANVAKAEALVPQLLERFRQPVPAESVIRFTPMQRVAAPASPNQSLSEENT